MDDLKRYGKGDDQLDSLVQTKFTFSENIGMEFCLKKCRVVILKRRKIVKLDGIHLPNQEIMKEVDKTAYTYLGILKLNELKNTKSRLKLQHSISGG